MKLNDTEQNHQPIVAVDMGSHGVRVMAADYDPMRCTLHIYGVEQSAKYMAIEHGVPADTEQAAYMVKEAVKKLTNAAKIPEPIQLYATIGGTSLGLTQTIARRKLPNEPISGNTELEMKQESKQKIEDKYPGLRVPAVVDDEWIAAGRVFDECPTDIALREIELHSTAFTMQRKYMENYETAFGKVGIVNKHLIARPDALVTALTSERHREDGCAIIDMGAQTTNLTIYHNGRFVMTRVIDMGGYDITCDLMELGMEPWVAEKLKTSGIDLIGFNEDKANHRVRIPATREGEEDMMLPLGTIRRTILYRLEQILAPIRQEIASRQEQVKHIFLTGAASTMKGLIPYMQQTFTTKVQFGSHVEWLENNVDTELMHPRYAALIGTIILASEYETYRLKRFPKKKGKSGFFGRIFDTGQQTIADLFGAS